MPELRLGIVDYCRRTGLSQSAARKRAAEGRVATSREGGRLVFLVDEGAPASKHGAELVPVSQVGELVELLRREQELRHREFEARERADADRERRHREELDALRAAMERQAQAGRPRWWAVLFLVVAAVLLAGTAWMVARMERAEQIAEQELIVRELSARLQRAEARQVEILRFRPPALGGNAEAGGNKLD